MKLRLFRADTRVGSIYYELSHDTLVEPILEGRRRRERRRFRMMSAGMGAVIFVLGAAVLWLGLGEPAWERARRALMVRLTPEATQRALASELKWAQIPAPPGGQFMMGCVGDHDRGCSSLDKPRHPVNLSQGFEIMAHEVTVNQFARFINAIGSTFMGRWLLPGHDRGAQDNHPVVNVSWFDAAVFCAVVGGRLPTEAEWEYAARGGNADAIYPWGNEFSADQANGTGMRGRDRWEQSAPVGSFPPNGFGLFDMVGNAREWTASVFQPHPYPSDGGRESSLSGKARVVRGGSWDLYPVYLRVSFRDDDSPSVRDGFVGFRCARDGSP